MKRRLSGIYGQIAILIAATLCLVQAGSAQQIEQSVKAAFLYNFTKYVTWPAGSFESATSPIVIGIVGQDSLGGALESTVSGKTVDGRSIIVRHYRWNDDLSSCHVLFVPAAEVSNASQLLRLKQRPILTVGESAGFARRFGMINFVLRANRVRFEINAEAAREGTLTISSKLLSLGIPPQ